MTAMIGMKPSKRVSTDGVLLLILACLVGLAMAACASTTTPEALRTEPAATQLPNPASLNCVKQGGKLSILKRADGSEYGLCSFPDKSQCEEWALYRGECRRGDSTGQTTYSDPFAYCAAVGTIDEPDSRYRGAAVPYSIVRGMIRSGIVSADAPPEFKERAAWRCADGKVMVCHFGANLPCLEKVNVSRIPSSAIQDFCNANPGADTIPAAITGRATPYDWKCEGKRPTIARQLFRIDQQGYLADFWFPLTKE